VRVVKPNQIGVLSRPYDHENKYWLSVAGLVLFPFAEPRYPMSESALWTLLGKELGAVPVDECMPKLRGEILLRANAYAPRGEPHQAVRVAVELDGKPLKELAVIGDRIWKDGVPTDPEAFVMKEIRWESAFGGPAFKRNPLGKGHRPKNGAPLPNIENPRRLITSARQLRDPVGFGPYDITWPQRMRRAGRYDKDWLENLYPGLARNIDWRFYNVAPPDQQVAGFFRGDEEIVLHNLHPEQPHLRCKLPEVQLRCFMRRRPRAGDEVQVELEMNLDTVWLFPHARMGVLVFHGRAPIREDDAADVATLYVACEDLGQPRSAEHYGEVLEKRLDKEHGMVAALDDAALMPKLRGNMKKPPAPYDEAAELMAPEYLRYKNLRKKGEREIERARDVLRRHGLDPDVHGPQPAEDIDPNATVEELIARADKAEKELQEHRRRLAEASEKEESELRGLCDQAGIDFDELRKEWRGPWKGGPPEPRAQDILGRMERLRDAARQAGADVREIEGYLADPSFVARLHDMDRQAMDGYRHNAQEQAAPEARTEEESAKLRADLLAAHRRGESLADRDLTGARLAGIDLSGANLEGALLEGCNLSQANLSRANLRRAVLVRANLTGATLDGANLKGANLSKAECNGASFLDCDLEEALLLKLKLVSTSLEGVNLRRAMVHETEFERCSLSRARADGVLFKELDLTATNFRGASLKDATFLTCVLDQADFTEGQLCTTTFLECRGTRAIFARVKGKSLRAVIGTELVECDFRGAELEAACFRGTKLAGSDFTDAKAPMADFSESNMQRCRLYHIIAQQSLFIRTDLTQSNVVGADLRGALLSKAILKGTDLRGANLYQADLAMVQGDKETLLNDALMVRARIKPFYRQKVQDLD
jgi:uncharacterized protein YjbI with pentapeptide repeats